MKNEVFTTNFKYLMNITGIGEKQIAAHIQKDREDFTSVHHRVCRWAREGVSSIKPDKFGFLLDIFHIKSIDDMNLSPKEFAKKYDHLKSVRTNAAEAKNSTKSLPDIDSIAGRILLSFKMRKPEIFEGMSPEDFATIRRLVAKMPKTTDKALTEVILDYRATMNMVRNLMTSEHADMIRDMATHLSSMQ